MLIHDSGSEGKHSVSVFQYSTDSVMPAPFGGYVDYAFGYFIRREVVFPQLDLLRTLGDSRYPEVGHSLHIRGDIPPTTDISALYASPYLRWTQYANNLVALLNGSWDFANNRALVPGEHPIYHRNLVGNTRARVLDNPFRPYEGDIFEDTDYSLAHRQFYHDAGSGAISYVQDELPALRRLRNYWDPDMLNSFSEFMNSGGLDPGGYQFFLMLPFQFTPVSCVVRYLSIYPYNSGGGAVLGAVLHVNTFSIDPAVIAYDPGELIDLQTHLGATTKLERAKVVDLLPTPYTHWSQVSREYAIAAIMGTGFGLNPSAYPSYKDCQSQPWCLFWSDSDTTSDLEDLLGYDVPRSRYYFNVTGYRRFHGFAENAVASVAGGNALSANSALDAYLGSLNTNHVETIAEIQELVKPFDLAIGLERLAGWKTGKRGGLLQWLKFLAAADLTYKFGVAPTIRAAQELSIKLLPLIDRLKSGFGPATAYGASDFEGDLFHHSVYDDVTVELRSKVRLIPEMDSFLPALFPLQSLGLLPTFSRIWEVLPYSWLIDRYFNVSAAGAFLDAAILWQAFEISYSVNSIAILYSFSESDLLDHGLENAEEDKAGFRSYTRYVINKGIPVVGPTALPIILSAYESPVSWDIIGSLLVYRL